MIYLSLLSVAAFAYFIVALQVSSGFPPLYAKNDDTLEDEIKPVALIAFGMIALALAASVISEIFLLFGLLSAWGGIRIRKTVKLRGNGPRSWLLNSRTIGLFEKWPMLAFDVWTVGMIVTFGLVIFSAGYSKA